MAGHLLNEPEKGRDLRSLKLSIREPNQDLVICYFLYAPFFLQERLVAHLGTDGTFSKPLYMKPMPSADLSPKP